MGYIILAVIACCMVSRPSVGLASAMGAGILFDLWSAETLGTTSIVLVMIAFCMYLYQKKYNTRSVWFFFIFALFAQLITEMVFARSLLINGGRIQEILIHTVIGSLLIILFRRFIWDPQLAEEQQLG